MLTPLGRSYACALVSSINPLAVTHAKFTSRDRKDNEKNRREEKIALRWTTSRHRLISSSRMHKTKTLKV
jgi:hypothetical protein